MSSQIQLFFLNNHNCFTVLQRIVKSSIASNFASNLCTYGYSKLKLVEYSQHLFWNFSDQRSAEMPLLSCKFDVV